MEGSVLELGKPIGDAISRIQFAPRSNNLLISSWDSFLRLYDVDASAMRFEALSDGALLDCCFVDESSALSVSSDGCVRRCDLLLGTQNLVGKHNDVVRYVEYSEQTGQAITAGMDKKLMFWDMKSGNVGCTKNVDSDVWSLSLSGPRLLAVIGRKVYIYDLRNLKEPVQSKDSSMKYQIQCISSFPSNEGYAIGSIDGCVELKYFDPSEDSGKGYAFRCHPKLRDCWSLATVNDIRFHPRDDTFVTGDNDGHAIIWNAKSRKKVFELKRHPNSVASVSYNQCGQLLAVASSHTYQEANEVEEAPQIYIYKLEDSAKLGSSE
ncbi:mitotic checkpoint protein BUB3.3 [Iris pallida]|uniref:Mitotic checkpoint protein BUB3.3 n=1 Tax=Iris pallida TaxID=29817 RepID=A0AAX6FAJ9_IRIPA|nr:mitotic checkpoint protein BUB3.3 [Iris pallida]KAJ6836829.1 mitotic checkpoint protein BUB3.3 [Iris pallida]